MTTDIKTSRDKTNVSFSIIFPLNLSALSSQIVMQIKTINAGKALKLLSSDFASFFLFLYVLAIGKPCQCVTLFWLFH